MVYAERVKQVGREAAQTIYLELITNCVAHHEKTRSLSTFMPNLKKQLAIS